jgi:hypothetical protein
MFVVDGGAAVAGMAESLRERSAAPHLGDGARRTDDRRVGDRARRIVHD